MRAPMWWPFELVTDPAETTVPTLIVRLPRGAELFLWAERGWFKRVGWGYRPKALFRRGDRS